jgi:hypothetical protein
MILGKITIQRLPLRDNMYSYYDLHKREDSQQQEIAQLQECYQNAVRESNQNLNLAMAYQLLGDFTLESKYNKLSRHHENIANEALLELKALKKNPYITSVKTTYSDRASAAFSDRPSNLYQNLSNIKSELLEQQQKIDRSLNNTEVALQNIEKTLTNAHSQGKIAVYPN